MTSFKRVDIWVYLIALSDDDRDIDLTVCETMFTTPAFVKDRYDSSELKWHRNYLFILLLVLGRDDILAPDIRSHRGYNTIHLLLILLDGHFYTFP